jgi:hypothetical protein
MTLELRDDEVVFIHRKRVYRTHDTIRKMAAWRVAFDATRDDLERRHLLREFLPERLLYTADVAYILGVGTRRVGALATERGIEPAQTNGRTHLWSAKQLVDLIPNKTGRPKGRTNAAAR